MLRSSMTTAGVVLLGATALAQRSPSDLGARLRPITSEVKNAGVLHLGTGQWTRHASPSANLAGPTVVYANTCSSGYFGAMIQNETWTDEGTLPDSTMPTQASTVIPGGVDTNAGCLPSYTINGFQIAYCTNSTVFDITMNFYSAYQSPTIFCTVPGAPAANFVITGLPASNGATQACWIVSFDLDAASATFSLAASNGADTNAFGWSFGLNSAPVAQNTDGPIIAGGVQVGGTSYANCTGTDATRWDRGTASVGYPGNVVQAGNFPDTQEEGTGMLTQDAFRVDGSTTAPSGPGCYYFGGNPLASFHLELYSSDQCGDAIVGTSICLPGQNGVIACPCGNNPVNPGAGCENSGQGQPATGGAILTATSPTGTASVSNDQVTLTATFVRTNTTSLFLQGNALIAAGAVFGDGVRCAGGQLLRLNSPGGTLSDGTGTVVYPNPAFPLPITQRVANLGQPINPGDTRWYGVYYRDPSLTFCPNPPGNTWNITQTVQITWQP